MTELISIFEEVPGINARFSPFSVRRNRSLNDEPTHSWYSSEANTYRQEMPGETATKSKLRLDRAPDPDADPEVLGPIALKTVPVVNKTPLVRPMSAALSKVPIALGPARMPDAEPGTADQPSTSKKFARALKSAEGVTVTALASPARNARVASADKNVNLDIIKLSKLLNISLYPASPRVCGDVRKPAQIGACLRRGGVVQ